MGWWVIADCGVFQARCRSVAKWSDTSRTFIGKSQGPTVVAPIPFQATDRHYCFITASLLQRCISQSYGVRSTKPRRPLSTQLAPRYNPDGLPSSSQMNLGRPTTRSASGGPETAKTRASSSQFSNRSLTIPRLAHRLPVSSRWVRQTWPESSRSQPRSRTDMPELLRSRSTRISYPNKPENPCKSFSLAHASTARPPFHITPRTPIL